MTGVYYYPEHWDESQWERDFKKMHELGFEFTHFAEFAWAQLEPEEGRYDFAWLDKAVALAAKYDLKVIMCTSTATPPVWMLSLIHIYVTESRIPFFGWFYRSQHHFPVLRNLLALIFFGQSAVAVARIPV